MRCGVWDLGFGLWGLGLRGLEGGFGVQVLELRIGVQDLGFGVQGVGCRRGGGGAMRRMLM